jgi:hypothetical protein
LVVAVPFFAAGFELLLNMDVIVADNLTPPRDLAM